MNGFSVYGEVRGWMLRCPAVVVAVVVVVIVVVVAIWIDPSL